MERGLYCYRFGSAEFDESRYELKVAGLPVEVERRALEVLLYLLQHAGEVVTKDELLREVWAGRITVDKVLPNAVTKLRRALGEANAERITTQARIGYRLDGPVSRMAVGRQIPTSLELKLGHAVPGRENFTLRETLSAHRGSEVWLAEHSKTREQRVYKFALDAERLRSLKREATLLRVLQEGAADSAAFVGLIDWNFEQPPFFLECQYGGLDLDAWSALHLPALDQAARIALFLQIADAVAAAHALGVLHKDLKPANVLVDGEPLQPHARLTDFGSGRMLDPDRLEQLGISRIGLSMTENLGADAYSGTPLYLAPEIFAGQAPTVQSDVYALGMLLYQLLSGQLRQPMAPGWEQSIADPLLCEDLRHATDGSPARRLSSAAELAARLRALPQRREEQVRQARIDADARQAQEALARSRARRPYVWALLGVLVVGLASSLLLQQRAIKARARAEAELARANAITRFLTEDLISRANPLVMARGAEAPLRDVLLSARERLKGRFQDQAETEASVRSSLASLFATLDLWAEAEQEVTHALELFDGRLGAASTNSVRARALRVHLLSRLSRFEDAESELARLHTLIRQEDPQQRHAWAKATASLHFNRGGFADAVPALREALATVQAADPGNDALRDSLRVDLVVALGQVGEHALARDEADALIAEARRRPGDHALLVALTQVAAARSHSYLGDDAKAEAWLLEAQPVVVDRLGESHTRHLGLLNELMAVYFRRNDWARALPYAEQVHQRIRDRLGETHNMSLVSRGNWGRLLYEMGRDQEAAAQLRPAHDALVQTLGAQAPQAQDLGVLRAAVELELGDPAMAARVIETLDAEVLENGRSTGLWQSSLDALHGMLLQRTGQPQQARTRLAASVAVLESDPHSESSRLFRDARAALRRLEQSAR